jgi:hypothetical protein
VEGRFDLRFQIHGHHRLRDSVRHRGNPENSDPLTAGLGYFDGSHRGWEVTSRGHSIPDLVEVRVAILLEILDRLPVHPGCTFVSLDSLIRLPHDPFADVERLVL